MACGLVDSLTEFRVEVVLGLKSLAGSATSRGLGLCNGANMNVRRLVLVLSIVTCGSLAMAAGAYAAGGGLGPGKYSFTSTSANADFGVGKGLPPGPSMSVFVNQGYNSFQPTHPKGPRIVTKSTMVQFSEFDPSTNSGGFGCFVIPATDFTVAKNLQTAGLHTTLTAAEACPGVGSPVAAGKDVTGFAGGGVGGLVLPITVDVTWTGYDVVTTYRNTFSLQCLNYKEDGSNASKDGFASAAGSSSALSGQMTSDFAIVSSSKGTLNVFGTAQPPCG